MIYVPEDISRRFEEAASTNTRQNTETCGILAGKLVCCLTRETGREERDMGGGGGGGDFGG